MAWNPSPEVAAARDMAEQFGWSRVVILHDNGKDFGYVSFGKTRSLCASAKRIGELLWKPFELALQQESRQGQVEK